MVAQSKQTRSSVEPHRMSGTVASEVVRAQSQFALQKGGGINDAVRVR